MRYGLTKDECLRIGGHCYEIDNCIIDTNPPIYHRICKHCGWLQEGRPQANMNWEDDPYQSNIQYQEM